MFAGYLVCFLCVAFFFGGALLLLAHSMDRRG